MRSKAYILLVIILVFTGCVTKKKLETSAPFRLGQAHAQKWAMDDEPNTSGYDIIIPIMSLDKKKATLLNVYYQGQMADLKMEMRDIGTVAIATFSKNGTNAQAGVDTAEGEVRRRKRTSEEGNSSFPFELGETEAVLSYLHNEKVRYSKIYGIQQHPEIIQRSRTGKIGQ